MIGRANLKAVFLSIITALALLASGCGRGLGTDPLMPAGGGTPGPTTGGTNPGTQVTVNITASPNPINSGQSSTLTITASNATSIVVTNNVDSTSTSVPPSGGTLSVTPSRTTTYTATATANGQTATANVTVQIAAAVPTVTMSANPASISAGQTSTLTVAATNATQVVITNNVDSSSITLGPTGGTATVTPSQTTTYTATATGVSQNATATTTITVTAPPTPQAPTVTIVANPSAINVGQSSTLTITATNATQVVVSNNNDSTTQTLPGNGGTVTVAPIKTTTYTATATGATGTTPATASTTVTVSTTHPTDITAIQHVIMMEQENRTFDTYFGMLNPYKQANGMAVGDDGKTYLVDGIDDKLATISNQDDEGQSFNLFKLATTCVDDMSSAWLESYGMVDRFNFKTTRPIAMDGFVHIAENFAKQGLGSGTYSDFQGKRAMGYYDQGFLNYYYFMGGQFAVSDRWFSPMSSKSIPNRIATFTGGTTQGLVKDPINNDHFGQLPIKTIFEQLDENNVSWKIYYSITEGGCSTEDECSSTGLALYPATTFNYFTYAHKYVYQNSSGAACVAPTVSSQQAVGDSSNSFCIDPNHIAPLKQYFTDLQNNTLPQFAFIETAYGHSDEHPGSGQSILNGQVQVAKLVNALMASPSWPSSVFFLTYDEGGGPYDHVPPVPGSTNKNTTPALGVTTDISSIAVNPDGFNPCVANGTTHCDLSTSDPGATAGDAAQVNGFAAQLGFRVPNFIVSPYTRKHYVSHTPMDHTAVLKFVENRFINSSAHLTARDAAQPDLTEFFDFVNAPWLTPPTPPAPVTDATIGHNTCTPATLGP